MGYDINAADDMLFLKVVSIDTLDYDELDSAKLCQKKFWQCKGLISHFMMCHNEFVLLSPGQVGWWKEVWGQICGYLA